MAAVTKDQSDYLAARMNEVSRSFALVVPSLEEPLDHYMATAYLLCRVADNIEDCGQPLRRHRSTSSAVPQHSIQRPVAGGAPGSFA